MRTSTGLLPQILIDSKLVKNFGEAPQPITSVVGEMFNIRTPSTQEFVPLELPEFTKSLPPKESDMEKIDYSTPTEVLFQANKVLPSPEIKKWMKANIHSLIKPAQYVGGELNTQLPEEFDTAEIRILVTRLSPYDVVGGSLTHGALSQILRRHADKIGVKIYVDFAYLPADMLDCDDFAAAGIPWMFARNSRRSPLDFDAILISHALTTEPVNTGPMLKFSGIPIFTTQRKMEQRWSEKEFPFIFTGGVVSDALEGLCGKFGEDESIVDLVIVADGEISLPDVLDDLVASKREDKTKAQTLRDGHKPERKWYYEPRAYEHQWDKEFDPETGYSELRAIVRKPGYEYALLPGQLEKCVYDDLDAHEAFVEQIVHYEGTLGNSVDIQISSGCLCLSGNTIVHIENGFMTLAQAHEQLAGESCIIKTRFGSFSAEGVVKTGIKKALRLTFQNADNFDTYTIDSSPDHKFDQAVEGEGHQRFWITASELKLGDEVWAVEREAYDAYIASGASSNGPEQFYFQNLQSVSLIKIEELPDEEMYDVMEVDEHNEFIANGLIVHNSGASCSFCLWEGESLVIGKNQTVPITECTDEMEIECPGGRKKPEGILYAGKQECLKVTTKLGHSIILTLDHPIGFFDKETWLVGYKEAQKFKVGDIAALSMFADDTKASDIWWERLLLFPETKSRAPDGRQVIIPPTVIQLEDRTRPDQELLRMFRRCSAYGDEIVSIEPVGKMEVWDVWDIPDSHAFITGSGFIVGNCAESHTQGRWRERSYENIVKAGEEAVAKQGADGIGFYSLTWTLHTRVYSLMLHAYSRYGYASLISQRADQASVDQDFFKFQVASGQHAATIGVEGVSQRTRNFLNKSLSTAQLMRAIENAGRGGLSQLKMFMILTGLEKAADYEEFCEFLREASKRLNVIARQLSVDTGTERKPTRLSPSFMLILPQPHTPLAFGPASACFDLESDCLRPVIDVTAELNMGTRTSMTRDRVRATCWFSMLGRDCTQVLLEMALRCKFLQYGPLPKRVTFWLEQNLWRTGRMTPPSEEVQKAVLSGPVFMSFDQLKKQWLFYFREKTWNHIFPWDAIGIPFRRDALWNTWKRVRESVGVAYCLKTSANVNPGCHSCGACDSHEPGGTLKTGKAKAKILTRTVEDSSMLIGQETARKDMTVRTRARFKVDIGIGENRFVSKTALGRKLVASLLSPLWKSESDNPLLNQYLSVETNSLKSAEGEGAQAYSGGIILWDLKFNAKILPSTIEARIPVMNEFLRRHQMVVEGVTVGEKFIPLGPQTYGLFKMVIPNLSLSDAKEAVGKFGLKGEVKRKRMIAVKKFSFKAVFEILARTETVPMVFADMTMEGTRVIFLSSLKLNPASVATQILGKKMAFLKQHPIECLGYYSYPNGLEEESDDMEGDVLAALAGQGTYCKESGLPIEMDVFSGEYYRSTEGDSLSISSDMGGLLSKRRGGIKTFSGVTN